MTIVDEVDVSRRTDQWRLGSVTNDNRLVLLRGIDPVETLYVMELKGELQCSMHTKLRWCIHIETAVKEHWDSKMWPSLSEMEDQEVIVPIVPSRDQWAIVRFDSVGCPPGTTKAYWEPEWAGEVNDRETDVFLGFIHAGEGRQVLRTTLLDNLKATVSSRTMVCSSPTHSYRAQMAWEQAIEQGTKNGLAEQWSVYNTGKCITCLSSTSDDFSDLVPDPGGTKWR